MGCVDSLWPRVTLFPLFAVPLSRRMAFFTPLRPGWGWHSERQSTVPVASRSRSEGQQAFLDAPEASDAGEGSALSVQVPGQGQRSDNKVSEWWTCGVRATYMWEWKPQRCGGCSLVEHNLA